MSWSPFYNFFDRDGFHDKENGAEVEWFKFYVNNETRLHKTWTGRSELSLSITDRYGGSSEQHTGQSRSKSIIYLPSPQNNKLMYNYISLTRETLTMSDPYCQLIICSSFSNYWWQLKHFPSIFTLKDPNHFLHLVFPIGWREIQCWKAKC